MRETKKHNVDSLYLDIYGLLRALFLQQDAAINLCDSLGISQRIDSYPRLLEIREIRNNSIGHPTKRDRRRGGGPITFAFISRASLSHTGFDYQIAASNGTYEFKRAAIPELILDQKRYVSDILSSVTQYFEDEDRAYRTAFKMEKLANLFPETLNYHIEKIHEGLWHAELVELSIVNINYLNDMLARYQEALERRGIELTTFDSINDLYTYLRYALDRLMSFYTDRKQGVKPSMDDKAAYTVTIQDRRCRQSGYPAKA